jgi:murein DD-endopeptidase MepM/ murein hydrolase activator NlpD
MRVNHAIGGGAWRACRRALHCIPHPLALIAALVLPCLPGWGAAQSAGPPAALSWEPATVVQGTLFRVIVNAPGVTAATGSAAGEPLHFMRTDSGQLVALAAAPLDGGARLEVNITITQTDGSSTPAQAAVPVAAGSYALDRLSVAPQFGARPNAAIQARLDRERARALEVSRRSHETPRLWDTIVRPRETRITSSFGNGREFNGQVQSRHTGTDFAGGVGDLVRAATRGVVALVDNFYLAGNVVYLDHGQGLVTAYFHLSETLVAQGDTVSAGQNIGKVGATGRVTGPHLHWVVRYGAISVDPLSLLALTSQ